MNKIDINEVIDNSKDLTLLYVEDNPDAREMTTLILENYFDNLIVAVNGEDGLEKFNNNHIDIVITDINMPKLNGLELCRKIREKDDDVSLVILSAHNDDSFFLESIDIGVNGYLLKPVEIDQLTNLLFRITQKHKYIKESKKNLHFLNVYQEAANQSSIISKTDKRGIITYVNDAFCKISGYNRDELIGKNHNIVRHPDNPKEIFKEIWHTIKKEKKIWKGIVRNRAKNGKSYYVDSMIMPITDENGDILEYISLRHDVTEIMNPQKQLINAIKNFTNPILVYIKLDRYEDMEEFYDNDTIELIQDKAYEYLKKVYEQRYDIDKLYRLGNGEYAFLIDKEKYLDKDEDFIKNMKICQEKIREEKIPIGEIEYDISILVSIAYVKNKILESAKLGIKKLLKTKRNFIIANNLADLELTQARKNMQTIFMIKKAIENSKIVSYFQPIVDNNTKKTVKYESLVRLIDENDKVVSPFFFLETSKKSNYYIKITNIVLEHSFSILTHCNADISINLSAIDIEQKTTREKIYNLLEKNKANASRVIFELLEDENVNEFETIKEFIKRVKEYGVKIAIDDFGAGYSNFERLLDYQPDILKIDGCLIKDIKTCNYSLSAVKSIVTFAKEQNIQTVAEFIESEDIFNIVKDLGIDYSQGYYFGKPAPLGFDK